MSAPNASAFTGDIPTMYDRGLGPVLFVTFAEDLSSRLKLQSGARVLELAAGTGILTEILARRLGSEVSVLATDLNDGMLDILRKRTEGKNVSAEVADAGELAYPDESFDALVCQFGVMFFADKIGSFREAFRVLKPGGRYIFNVWNSVEKNDFARCADEVLRAMFPENPPKFYQTPFGFHDTGVLESQLREAGFDDVRFEHVPRECYA